MTKTIDQFIQELNFGAGGWSIDGTWDRAETAALIDIMRSLRAIRRILECPNVIGMATAAQSIEKMVRKKLAKKRKPNNRIKASRN